MKGALKLSQERSLVGRSYQRKQVVRSGNEINLMRKLQADHDCPEQTFSRGL
jgi:hypothetical protein